MDFIEFYGLSRIVAGMSWSFIKNPISLLRILWTHSYINEFNTNLINHELLIERHFQ